MDTERIIRLERLMAAHGTDIIRLCALQLGDKDQAEDAAQDTFVKAWRALPRFKGECSEKPGFFALRSIPAEIISVRDGSGIWIAA